MTPIRLGIKVSSRNSLKTPNDRSFPALIPAWESGIDSIIVLPYRGYFARRITRRHVVVSAEVRSTPEQYSRALTESISA
ncbi:hypothetical protein [Arthrobacter sp. SAFR-044]|uniref:hypothetical protein n=1 Tax=Arthrobacter sp. SAFR-044 TaxID=3387278 RepID=UPI003F7CC151